jgi:hypothetical protein
MDGLQLPGNAGRFDEIWACDFEFQAPGEDSLVPPGERVRPVCMVAEELLSRRQIRLWQDEFGQTPPFDIGDRSLFVSFSATAEFSCFLVLGWPKPKHILDLYVEQIALRNGLGGSHAPKLTDTLAYYGIHSIDAEEKAGLRKLILERTAWSAKERIAILDYCYTDVLAIRNLFPGMAPLIKRPWQALLRGDFMWAIAVMEFNGIPLNRPLFQDLQAHWDEIRNGLTARIDQNCGVYRLNKDGTYSFSLDLFEEYLLRHDIGWPRTEKTEELHTTDEVFEERAKTYPQLTELRYLRYALGKMNLFSFPVGADGFNRSWLHPFGSKTGRNQPSPNKFIFGASSWMRHLVQAPPGYALSYIDWSNQEFAIAAYLSGDPVMIKAYESGDPYVYFAKFAGAIPPNAVPPGTTLSELNEIIFEAWDETRSLYKTCVLGTQYFIAARSLAARLNCSIQQATKLLQMHREAFRVYWSWIEDRISDSFEAALQETAFGWSSHISEANEEYRSVGNFFCQANGADMMRLSAIRAVAENIHLCCSIHDAFLIMAPLERIEEDTRRMQEIMAWASGQVLDGPLIRSEARIFRHPRFFNKVKPKAKSMWHKVRQELKTIKWQRNTTLSLQRS